MTGGRIIVQFSCGATSAVAGKLTLAKYQGKREVVIVNAFIADELADNRRFLADCERWYNYPITVLRDEKYGASPREVWRRTRYINGQRGATCSKRLKRDLLDAFRTPLDTIVLGFDASEQRRYDDFLDNHPGEKVEVPLIERGLEKADCLAMVQRAGIELPEMYRMGYSNANCPGCCKGGEGYWNKIRLDFPKIFEETMVIQEAIGPGSYFFRDRKTGERFGLKDLPPGKGRMEDEPEISCSFFCESAEKEIQ